MFSNYKPKTCIARETPRRTHENGFWNGDFCATGHTFVGILGFTAWNVSFRFRRNTSLISKANGGRVNNIVTDIWLSDITCVGNQKSNIKLISFILKERERPKFQILMSMFPPSLDYLERKGKTKFANFHVYVPTQFGWRSKCHLPSPKMTSAILYLWRKCRNRVTIVPSFKRSHWQLFGTVNASVSATETETNGQLVRRRSWSCCSFNCCLWFRVLIVVTATALGGCKQCNFHYQDN